MTGDGVLHAVRKKTSKRLRAIRVGRRIAVVFFVVLFDGRFKIDSEDCGKGRILALRQRPGFPGLTAHYRLTQIKHWFYAIGRMPSKGYRHNEKHSPTCN